MMVRRVSHIVVLTASLAMGTFLATPTFAAPIQPAAIGEGVGAAIDLASFWGLPYPFGYSYAANRCIKHVRVQTKHGRRWKRVWVCD